MYVPGYGLGNRVVLSHSGVTLELTRAQFNGIGYLRQPIPETHRQVLGYTPQGSAIVGGGRRLRWKFLFDLVLSLAQWERLLSLWGSLEIGNFRCFRIPGWVNHLLFPLRGDP